MKAKELEKILDNNDLLVQILYRKKNCLRIKKFK